MIAFKMPSTRFYRKRMLSFCNTNMHWIINFYRIWTEEKKHLLLTIKTQSAIFNSA